jgi:H+-transporting ATPase
MDVVKVWVYRAWSFELTARLVPTRARVSKLKQRAELRILSQRVARNVERARNVLRIINVLQHFKSYKPPHYAVIKQALPKGHH